MPKERFHLHLAERCLESMSGILPAPVEHCRTAFLIGALSPDIFFYDLPSFSLTPLGDALHNLMEREGVAPVADWMEHTARNAARERLAPDPRDGGRGDVSATDLCIAWGMGFACHFLADAVWHPVINRLSGSLDFCSGKKLRAEDCHHLLECELEALWLGRSGDPGRYTALLHLFRKDRKWLLRIASCHGRFLRHAGLAPVPSDRRIAGCHLDQNLMLRIFVNRFLGLNRDRLLAFGPTRYLGGLVVPARPLLPSIFAARFSDEENPLSGHFLDEALKSITRGLSGLAQRLEPFLPS